MSFRLLVKINMFVISSAFIFTLRHILSFVSTILFLFHPPVYYISTSTEYVFLHVTLFVNVFINEIYDFIYKLYYILN